MSKTTIVCLIICGICTLALLIDSLVTSYRINKAYKELRRLRGEE